MNSRTIVKPAPFIIKKKVETPEIQHSTVEITHDKIVENVIQETHNSTVEITHDPIAENVIPEIKQEAFVETSVVEPIEIPNNEIKEDNNKLVEVIKPDDIIKSKSDNFVSNRHLFKPHEKSRDFKSRSKVVNKN